MEGGPPTISTTRLVKARVTHACVECEAIIQPGEYYEIVDGLWEGSWQQFKTCEPCAEVRNHLKDTWNEGIPFYHLQDELAQACIYGDFQR